MYKQYNTSNCSLVLNLDFDIPKNHDARFINLLADSILIMNFLNPPPQFVQAIIRV